nr:HAMP domain-containing sensor histidine kinase [Lachnoclostridium edouardi]
MRYEYIDKQENKTAFLLSAVLIFTAISTALVRLKPPAMAFWVFLSSAGMGISVFVMIYLYFLEQNKIMERAVGQIRDYLSGERGARIECDSEGELYRLFHEVNYLTSVLNAHAKNEEQSKKFMKDTISHISHQLKTPLAALNIYNSLMQDETADISTLREFTELSEQELDRIETLVQNLLKIAKLDAGTVVINKAVENVSEMMGYIQRHFTCQAKQEGKKLIFSGNDTITLFCDLDWLTEAVSNIVKNAFDHTKEGVTIYVQWRTFVSTVQIIIQDNGRGIHPEDLPHIFKRFYRSRFSKDIQGVGLGLPLTKAIIEAHHGTLEVDSILDVGTTFTVNFLIPTKL